VFGHEMMSDHKLLKSLAYILKSGFRYALTLIICGARKSVINEQGHQTHIMTVVGHQSKASYTQKKSVPCP
jgi:hypothetical protein